MTKTRRSLGTGGLAFSGLVLAGACLLAVPAVNDAVFTHFVEHHLRTGNGALLRDDALRVLLCATSAPYPDPHCARTCTAVIADGHYYLVDTGPGSGRNLKLWQLRGRELAAVFLTHFHSDHIGDLGEVNTNTWLAVIPEACRSMAALRLPSVLWLVGPT